MNNYPFPIDDTAPLSRNEDINNTIVRNRAWIGKLFLTDQEQLPFYLGTPTNAIVGAQATKETTIGASKIEATANDEGTAGNELKIKFLDAGAPGAPLSVVQNGNDTEVTLETDDGIAASHVLLVGDGTGTKQITTTLEAVGPGGNDWSLNVSIPTQVEPMGSSAPTPSATLEANVSDGVINVLLATDEGTPAALTLTEGSGSLGSLSIVAQSDWSGAWANDAVTAVIRLPSAQASLLDVAINVGASTIKFEITLASDAEGDVIAISDDDLVTAINAKLTSENLIDYFLVESATAGDFDSAHATTAMSGGADAVAVVGGANQADEVAAVIAALTGVDTAVVGAGAGNEEVAVTAASNFTLCGTGYVSLSTCAEVVDAIEELETKPLVTSVSDGPGTDVIPLNQADISLAAGADVTPATPGYLAIDDDTLWVKLTVDGVPTTWTALTPVA